MELTDTSTILHGVIHNRPGYWVRLAPSSEIRVDGVGYPVTAVDGFALGEQIVAPESGVIRFTMKFPAIPKKAQSMEFTENVDNGWCIWGIDLTGKADHNINQKSVPAEAKREREMPESKFAYGDTSVINVHILGYRPEMGNKLTWCANTLHGQVGSDTPAEIDETGNAVVKLELSAPGYFMPICIGDGINLGEGKYIAPGENLNVYLDSHISGIWNMETREDAKTDYLKGYISSFADGVYPRFKRVATMPIYSGEFGDYRMNGDEYTAYIIDVYNSISDSIAANPSLSENDRRFNRASLMAELVAVAGNPTGMLSRNYYLTHPEAGWGSPIPTDSLNCELTPENLRAIAALVDFNNADLLLSDMISDGINTRVWDNAGIDTGLFKMVEKYNRAYAAAENGRLTTPLPATWNLNPALSAELEAHNAAVVARIEALGAERMTPAPDVAPAEMFDAIIAPHKGKVVMVDLWNTWCGPCRAAIAQNEPEKSGDLSSDDIVWIYIANQTSPMVKYLQMIPDIKGIHYRLDEESWRAICDRFKVDGIPYYILVDRDGNAEGRPDLRDHSLYKKTLLEKL